MEQKKNRARGILYFSCLYSLFIIILIIYWLKNGYSFIIKGDGINYGMPNFLWLSSYFKDILNGKLYNYSFKIGFGNAAFSTLPWTGLGDFFSLLLIFANDNNIHFIVGAISFMRLYLTGIFMLHCLSDSDRYPPMTLASLTIVYVFSSYTFQRGLQFTNFQIGIMVLPLLFKGMEDIISRNKKNSIEFILGTFLLAMNGFYFLYIELLIIAVYSLIKIFFNQISLKYFLEKTTRLFKHALVGMGSAAIVLVPSLYGFFTSPRGGFKTIFLGGNYIDNLYQSILGIIIPGKSFYQFGIPICLMLIIVELYILHWKKMTSNMLLLLITALAVISRNIGYILNGFSLPQNDRWYFVLVFLACINTRERLAEDKDVCKNVKEKVLSALLITFIFSLNILYYVRNSGNIVIAILYIVLLIISIICICTNLSKKIWSYVVLLNVLINIFVIILPSSVGGANKINDFTKVGTIAEIIKNENIKTINTDDDFRVDLNTNNSECVNNGMLTGVKSTSQYLSTSNKNVYNFYIKYGLYTSSSLAGLQYWNLNSRNTLEDIFAVKKFYDISSKRIIDNVDCVEWGNVYDSYITQSEFEKMNMLKRQSVLCQAVVVPDNSALTKSLAYQKKINFTDSELDYVIYLNDKQVKKNNNIILTGNDVLTIVPRKNNDDINTEYYLLCEKIYSAGKDFRSLIYLNGERTYILSENIINNTEESILFSKIAKEKVEIVLDNIEDVITFDKIHIFKYNVNEQREYLKEREGFRLLEINEDSLKGIVSGENRIVVFPVFFDKNFEAKINGSKVPIFEVNNGLIGVLTNSSENEIQLRYKSYEMILGGILSAVSLLLLVILFAERKLERGRDDSKFTNKK